MVLLLMGLAFGTETNPLSAQRSEVKELIAYRCDDLVVVAPFENLDYDHVEIKNDLLGHGWVTARVRIRRVLAGQSEGRVLPVRYLAHTYAREDRDFVLVIERAEKGDNLIREAHLFDGNRSPPLAPTCD